MTTYIVTTQQLYTERIRVEADSEEEALEKAYNSDGDIIDNSLEFDEWNPLDNASEWNVEEG